MLPRLAHVQGAQRSLVNGVSTGLIAGIPQVLLTPIASWLLPAPRGNADIGPRPFVGGQILRALLHALALSHVARRQANWLRWVR